MRWIAAVLVGILFSCIGCSEGEHEKREQPNPTSGTLLPAQSGNSPQPESRNAMFSTSPFAISTGRVPSGYAGVNLEELASALLDRHNKRYKNEFETTAQYKERLRQLDSNPILGSLRLDSIYAFSFRPSSARYNADARELRVTFESSYSGTYQGFGWLEYGSKGTSYPAQNAFGAEATVQTKTTNWYGITIRNLRNLAPKIPKSENDPFSGVVFRIPIRAEEAKVLKDRLKILVVCKLQAPFLTVEEINTEATITSPLKETTFFNLVHVRVEQLKVYAPDTGRILGVIASETAQKN